MLFLDIVRRKCTKHKHTKKGWQTISATIPSNCVLMGDGVRTLVIQRCFFHTQMNPTQSDIHIRYSFESQIYFYSSLVILTQTIYFAKFAFIIKHC